MSTLVGTGRELSSFDVNSPELEDWLSKQQPGPALVEKLEIVAGRARKPRPKKPKPVAPFPCPYESFLSVYHEELVDWVPDPKLALKWVGLDPVSLRVGKVWIKRKEAMDAMWYFVLTSIRGDGNRRAQTEEEALEWLREYFGRVRRIGWMMGTDTGRSGPHAGWRADFDYLVAERAWPKVIEHRRAEESA